MNWNRSKEEILRLFARAETCSFGSRLGRRLVVAHDLDPVAFEQSRMTLIKQGWGADHGSPARRHLRSVA